MGGAAARCRPATSSKQQITTAHEQQANVHKQQNRRPSAQRSSRRQRSSSGASERVSCKPRRQAAQASPAEARKSSPLVFSAPMESTLARASSIRAFIRRSALSSSSWVAGRPVTPSNSFRSGKRLCSSTPSCLHQPETHQPHCRQRQTVCEAAVGAPQAVLWAAPCVAYAQQLCTMLAAHVVFQTADAAALHHAACSWR